MGKFIDSKGMEILKDVTLWTGSHTDYGHNVTLSQSAFNFKELIVILNDRAIIMPIVNKKILNAGVTQDYRAIACNVSSYNDSTKSLVLSTALWTNVNVNGGTTLTAVYGRSY